MRLSILDVKRRAWHQRLFLSTVRRTMGTPGPLIVYSYRPHFFGVAFTPLCNRIMRGTRFWGKAEMELFAAAVSRYSACVY